MPLTFGSSDNSGANGAQAGMNPFYGLLGAGAGLASQFANGPYGPGAQQSGTLPFMQNQWQNVFNAQNAAANRPASAAIAGFTPAQQQAMASIQSNQQLGLGDLQNSQNTAATLAQGIGARQIQNFMNPFTQSAINGTLGTMEQQRQQQDAAINSQANAANAWGGDRSAVANNLNDQGWQLAEGNVIGNLNNQGYQSAVNSAFQNQTAQLAGNSQLQNAILNRINATNFGNQNLLGVGNAEQSLNQQLANYPVVQGQIMAQNLNPNVGTRSGTLQNPYTGAIAGLQGGLQFGNALNSLVNNGQSAYNYLANGGLDASQMDTLNSLTSSDLGIGPSGAGGQAAGSAASSAAPGVGGGSLGAAGYGGEMTSGEFGMPLGTGAGAGAGAAPAGMDMVDISASALPGAGAAGFAGAGGDALGTTAAADAGASFGTAGAADLGTLGSVGMAGGALAGLYGLYALDQSQGHYNPLDASNALKASATNTANRALTAPTSGSAPYNAGINVQQSDQQSAAMLSYLSQLMLTNPQLASSMLATGSPGGRGQMWLGERQQIKQN